ncbi:ABC transporter substrate-binding protein [Arthrobacter mobilis]|uniref:ABC transporter substrate-binding protein n=1 Tax=Arthrobacter mobilis TaxID=2724944 RepID=A0A7X6HBU4_9MICC|nr:ABC transporter substrate-binding protein [Arthrobacter mobilis]NKX54214.1 ABC transporter substrate-binding protein [Arthrobacter mobilis]
MEKKFRSYRKARILAPVVAAMAALSLAACEGSPGAGAAGAGEDGGKSSIRLVVAPIHFETAYIAEQQGYFDEAGLDVEIVTGADPAANLAMAVSGEADITTGSWISVATSASKGVPVTVISGNGIVDPETANSGILVNPDSGLKTIADLKGKTIGVVGVKTGSDIPVLQAIEDAGLKVEDIKEVAIPYSGMQAAIEQKTVDAVVPADTFYHQMIDAGYTSIANPVLDYQANMPVTVWTATKEWVAANPGTAEKFNDAMEKAAEFYSDKANIDEVKALTAEVNQVDVSQVDAGNYVPVSVAVNTTTGQAGIDAMEHFGLVKDPITAEELLWDKAPRTSK